MFTRFSHKTFIKIKLVVVKTNPLFKILGRINNINNFKGFETSIKQLKGDVLEFQQSGSFNIDSAINDSPYLTNVDRSHEYASADIKTNWGEEYGLKALFDGKVSAKAQSISHFQRFMEYKSVSGRTNLCFEDFITEKGLNPEEILATDPIYSGQMRLIPSDQAEEAIAYLKQQIAKKHPGLTYLLNGWTILLGRTASENDELLRHHVKGQDMWMHTRDYSGGYVFIKNRNGKTIPLDILLNAGNLAVYHSKARKNGSADLYYTQVKHLRRAKNAPKGTVLPTNEKNLSIKIESERLKIMEEALQD